MAVFVSLWLLPAHQVILEKIKLPENPGLGCVIYPSDHQSGQGLIPHLTCV